MKPDTGGPQQAQPTQLAPVGLRSAETFSRRFWWTLPLTIAVALLAMLGHRIGPDGVPAQAWIELAKKAGFDA